MAGLQLLSEYGLRVDGRRPNELRQIRCKLGVFNQPDGSAYLEQGNTKVLAAVYGPHEVKVHVRSRSEKTANFSVFRCAATGPKSSTTGHTSIANAAWPCSAQQKEKGDQGVTKSPRKWT
jgi:hypothetical protein